MTEKFNLDRKTNVENFIDADGKKWDIHIQRGNGLYFTRPNPDRSDAVIPKNMAGRWTKPELLKTEILKYVNASWDKADAAIQKAERKKVAAKEKNGKANKEGHLSA